MISADLAAHLRERIRPVGSTSAVAAGELVLYWMHHAVRAEENPALDVAVAVLGLPLLVYHGLGGRHSCESDRHHTFILEGARGEGRSPRLPPPPVGRAGLAAARARRAGGPGGDRGLPGAAVDHQGMA